MTTDTATKVRLPFAVNDRVVIDAPDAYPELNGGLATVTGYNDFFDEYNVFLDEVPRGYEVYSWDTRSWTLAAKYINASNTPNPDPRPWPEFKRHTRVMFKESTLIGTVNTVRPTDNREADYQIAMDNGSKVFATDAELVKFTDEWNFNGIVHKVRVTPDHSGREGGGWLFNVDNGMRDSIGWVRADAAQALARMILGIPPLDSDADIEDAVDY